MKKIIATSALAISFAFSAFTVFAACAPGEECIEITNPSFDECVGDCDGGALNAWSEGNTFGEINMNNQMQNPEQVWAEGCTALEIGTTGIAPADGEASISNITSQGMNIESIRPDGSGGVRMQDFTTASLDTTATNGGVSGGMVFSENQMNTNLWNDTWKTGSRSGLESQTQMAGMVCETPGTNGKLDSQVLNSSFQQFDNGKGVKTFQSSQHLGSLKIN